MRRQHSGGGDFGVGLARREVISTAGALEKLAGRVSAAEAAPARGIGMALSRLARQAWRLAAAALLLAAAVPRAAAVTSPLWGVSGELWNASSRLMDWSFAGYHQGNDPLPSPPVTRDLDSFRRANASDTDTFLAALAWAHKQPLDQWVVIGLPARTLTLTKQLFIKRPRLILRGAGQGKTVIYIPKPLLEVIGRNPKAPKLGWFDSEGFIWIGVPYTYKNSGATIATITGTAKRGGNQLLVQDAKNLRVGTYYLLTLSDKSGALSDYLLSYKLPTGPRTINRSNIIRFATRITAIKPTAKGALVTFERTFPFDVRPDFLPKLYVRQAQVYEVGLEGFTFSFKWAPYQGHHHEAGFNAVQMHSVYDVWMRDIEIVNPDSGIFIEQSTGVQIDNLLIRQTKPRMQVGKKNQGDGHWSVHPGSSPDVLVNNFRVVPRMIHGMGTDAFAMYGVFSNGYLDDSNLELHRAMSGQNLYTNIAVGDTDRGIGCGGPAGSGPCSQHFCTFWNCYGTKTRAIPVPHFTMAGAGPFVPGSCDFAPDVNFIGTKLLSKVCKDWLLEPDVTQPANLWEAQLARRKAAMVRG